MLRDVEDGFTSAGAAEAVYGVSIRRSAIDEAATAEARATLDREHRRAVA